MLASCAVGDDLGGQRLSFLASVSGLSILTSTAPAATFWPRSTESPDASIDPRGEVDRVASTSPWTSSGSGRTRYQIDRPATARPPGDDDLRDTTGRWPLLLGRLLRRPGRMVCFGASAVGTSIPPLSFGGNRRDTWLPRGRTCSKSIEELSQTHPRQ